MALGAAVLPKQLLGLPEIKLLYFHLLIYFIEVPRVQRFYFVHLGGGGVFESAGSVTTLEYVNPEMMETLGFHFQNDG